MSTAYDDIKTQLQGSMVALVTPMHPDGKVDYKRLADLTGKSSRALTAW